jgi:hypothetical protein
LPPQQPQTGAQSRHLQSAHLQFLAFFLAVMGRSVLMTEHV